MLDCGTSCGGARRSPVMKAAATVRVAGMVKGHAPL